MIRIIADVAMAASVGLAIGWIGYRGSQMKIITNVALAACVGLALGWMSS